MSAWWWWLGVLLLTILLIWLFGAWGFLAMLAWVPYVAWAARKTFRREP